jgi:hypothetical protein
MKKIALIIFITIYVHCTARVISPGITSSQRIKHIGTTNQLEATLYYGQDFEMSAFYILPEFRDEIFSDPNNTLSEDNKIDKLKESSDGLQETLLLYEICMNKDKDSSKDIFRNFKFLLNGSKVKDSDNYPYPYSYYIYGQRKKKYASYHETFAEYADNYDYINCQRFILNFSKDAEKEGQNILRIETPTNNIAEFQYSIKKNEFVKNDIDKAEYGGGFTVSTHRNNRWGKGNNSDLVRIKKE